MSQQTMSQLASLASRPDPAADTLAHYQALPVAQHQLEEATYGSGALGVDDVVGWAASLDPSPEVIHIDMRSPTRNSYLGGRGWATTLWRELRRQLPSLKFLHLTPLPSSVDQLLNSMRTNPVGKPKDAHVQCIPITVTLPRIHHQPLFTSEFQHINTTTQRHKFNIPSTSTKHPNHFFLRLPLPKNTVKRDGNARVLGGGSETHTIYPYVLSSASYYRSLKCRAYDCICMDVTNE